MDWNRKSPLIEEIYTESKTGRQENNEDAIYQGTHFVAVIDGATSKTKAVLDGKTGGQLCAQQIMDTIHDLDENITGEAAVSQIYMDLKEMAKLRGLEQKGIHCCASAVIFSCARREIWAIGDCQYMIDGQHYTNSKSIDRIMSEARVAAIYMLLQKGITEEQLLQHDHSREIIFPLLQEQKYLENSKAPYGYSVFNCYTQPDFIIQKVPDRCRIVLASDGYPFLRESLAESERELSELLKEDPLCYKKYCSTKGLQAGNISFDDRSYIRFSLGEFK